MTDVGRSVNLDILGTILVLVGTIVLGILAILWVDRWRKRPERLEPEDELAQFRSMHEAGLLSAEEFAKIRRHLEQKKPAGGTPDPSASSLHPQEEDGCEGKTKLPEDPPA